MFVPSPAGASKSGASIKDKVPPDRANKAPSPAVLKESVPPLEVIEATDVVFSSTVTTTGCVVTCVPSTDNVGAKPVGPPSDDPPPLPPPQPVSNSVRAKNPSDLNITNS